MFRPFLDSLRRHGVPVSLREWLDLMAAMNAGLAGWSVEEFHGLGRAILVKDERHVDRYDRAFAESFSGLETVPLEALVSETALPREWLEKLAEKLLTSAQADVKKAAAPTAGSASAEATFAPLALRATDPLHLQWKSDIACDAEMGPERIVLKHQPDPPPVRRGERALVADDAPRQLDRAGIGPLQPGDHAQDGRLAAAAWTQQRQKLPALQSEADRLYGAYWAERLA